MQKNIGRVNKKNYVQNNSNFSKISGFSVESANEQLTAHFRKRLRLRIFSLREA